MSKFDINIPAIFSRKNNKYCRFCRFGFLYIDYKNIDLLLNFVNSRGKILPRKYTGNCKIDQNSIAQGIKRARHLGLLPFNGDIYK